MIITGGSLRRLTYLSVLIKPQRFFKICIKIKAFHSCSKVIAHEFVGMISKITEYFHKMCTLCWWWKFPPNPSVCNELLFSEPFVYVFSQAGCRSPAISRHRL